MAREVRGPETGGALPRSAAKADSTVAFYGLLALLVISPFAFLAAILTVASSSSCTGGGTGGSRRLSPG